MGIGYAAIAMKAGFTSLQTVSMSVLVYAGAGQIIAASMALSSASVMAVILTNFVVNLRYFVMSTCVLNKIEDSNLPLNIFAAHVTVDESLKATIKAAIAEIPADIKVTAETDGAVKAINALQTAIESLKDKTVNVTVIEKVSKAKGSNIPTKTPKTPSGLKPHILEEKILGAGSAQGNVAFAGGRSTLMGELGPELYVTNGHYYVAGKNGAEFVDLPDDAIVFNHLQTRKLLDKGASGRGRAVTNE